MNTETNKDKITSKDVFVFLLLQLATFFFMSGCYFINKMLDWDYYYSIPVLSIVVFLFWVAYDVIYNDANIIDPHGDLFKKKGMKDEVHSGNQN